MPFDDFDKMRFETLSDIQKKQGSPIGQRLVESSGQADVLTPEQVPVTPDNLRRGIERAMRMSDNPNAKKMVMEHGFPPITQTDLGGGTVPVPPTVGDLNTGTLGFLEKLNPKEKAQDPRKAIISKVMTDGIEGLSPEEKQVWDQVISKSGSEIALDPEEVSYAATIFRKTGTMPNFGFGAVAAKLRKQILHEAAVTSTDEGVGAIGDLASRAEYKASSGEQAKVQAQRGIIMSFENTANSNMALALSLSEKVDRTGSPLFNRYLNASKREIINDPDLARFEAATNTAANEYARVVNTASGGGVNTESARAEAHRILNTAQSPEAFKAVIQTLRQDMQNRRTGYEKQIEEIQRSISGKSATPTLPPGVPQGSVLKGTKNGKPVYQSPDGKLLLVSP